MILKDRRKLAKLMAIDELTHRDLAQVAGYRAHSHVSRLLRGEVDTLSSDAALRIADRLGVAVDDLFLPVASRNPEQPVHESVES